MDMPVKITVTENQISLMQGARTQSGEIVNEKAELMVMNSAGAELPNSGGPGTTWIYLFGTILLLGCGILLIARRRVGRE